MWREKEEEREEIIREKEHEEHEWRIVKKGITKEGWRWEMKRRRFHVKESPSFEREKTVGEGQKIIDIERNGPWETVCKRLER